jgi:multiple sugar transport system substrate-binding protein
VTLTISASAVGAEGTVLRAQLERYMRERPGVRVAIHPTPDGADNRHQLYVQWLNARAGDPDVLQVDIIWTAELAAAGWLLPLDRFGLETADFFPAAIRADTWEGSLYAVPWFADVGMLYYRTDLVPRAPATVDELVAFAAAARREHGVEGFVWQGARYEGLTCTFLEQLGAFGGSLDDVDTPAARRALEHLRRLVTSGISPIETLNFDEERVRFAFQNGHAAFMRNWPYALALVDDSGGSRASPGRWPWAPCRRAPGGRPTATLGGGQLAINDAHSEHPEEPGGSSPGFTAPAQDARAALARRRPYPTRPALHEDANLRRIVEAGEPRPVTPGLRRAVRPAPDPAPPCAHRPGRAGRRARRGRRRHARRSWPRPSAAPSRARAPGVLA